MAPTSLRKQRAEQAQRRFARLKDGAVLCRLHQRNRMVWCLVWRDGSEWLTHRAVTEVLASENVVGVGNALPFAGAELSQTIDGLNDLRRLPAAPPLSNKWREPMMKHDWPTREQWAEQRRTVYFDMENPNPADKRP